MENTESTNENESDKCLYCDECLNCGENENYCVCDKFSYCSEKSDCECDKCLYYESDRDDCPTCSDSEKLN